MCKMRTYIYQYIVSFETTYQVSHVSGKAMFVQVSLMQQLMCRILQMVRFLVLGAVVCASATWAQKEVVTSNAAWDIVVLGRIEACWVCQFGPQPHVSYTRVLVGQVPNGQSRGQLAITEVPEWLLPQGGIPMYKSQREEICFLKRIVVPGYENTEVYKVVDVQEVTPENLAALLGQ